MLGRLRRLGDARCACALAMVLGVALCLRLWGIKQGLPYAYNVDEGKHFVPKAVAMFSQGLNPHYFINPPALTYLLHLVFAVWFGGHRGVLHEVRLHPGSVFLLARVTVALLGTLAIWLLYLLGGRLFDRRVGLLAAGLMAVAFLPVFYAHLALNDVPTLAPLTLSLLGSAGVLRSGRVRDYLIAGVGLGLGCATKYTAGIALLPLLGAAVAQYLNATPTARRRVEAGVLIAGVTALGSFLIANPFSVLDFQRFHSDLIHQSAVSGEAQGKLGAPRESGILYYLWSFTWGLGWVPALAALGGAVTVWRWDRSPIGRWLGWLLVPAPLLFIAFMGLQGRYFGRWLLPIFPIVCLLAAFFALQAAGSLARRLPRLRGALVALAVVALCAQGATYSIHSGIVLARADTRNLTRAWMLAHIPAGTRIVVEPVVTPNSWFRDIAHLIPTTPGGVRWLKYHELRLVVNPANGAREPPGAKVTLENYERTLGPALIEYYERHGYCWVVSGSTQSGRAFADPRVLPHAIAYYKALEQQGNVAYHVSPYAPGKGPVAFNFDWSFDYYPLAYARPGPEMTVYRLRGGRCAG